MNRFDHKHYVPILRWKAAEKAAICNLFRSPSSDPSVDITRITPLIEIPPDKFWPPKDPEDKAVDVLELLRKAADDVLDNWGDEPLFVDFHLLPKHLRDATRQNPFRQFAEAMRARKITMVPVTGLDRSPGYQTAVAKIANVDNHGVCIRLSPSDLQNPKLKEQVSKLLNFVSLTPETVDLIVDWGKLEQCGPDLAWICSKIPYLSRWRTFTFASGSFPVNLTGFSVGKHQVKRWDWITWHSQVIKPTSHISRLPTFSDYSIQHPIYTDHSQNDFIPNISASIRYTTEETWVIMRGEGLRTSSHGYDQYPANASLLCESDVFYGHSFSFGDSYIKERSLELEKPIIEHPGSPQTWLRAGINHHITLTLSQIANLS